MKRIEFLHNKELPESHEPESHEVVVDDIQKMLIAGTLKINQLDPKKTYIFTLGDFRQPSNTPFYWPSQDDIVALRDMLEVMRSGIDFNFIVAPPSLTVELATQAQITQAQTQAEIENNFIDSLNTMGDINDGFYR